MKTLIRIVLINILCFIYPFIASAKNDGIAIIKVINKISGKYYIHEVSKGELLKFRNMALTSSQCIINKVDNNSFAAFISLKKINQDKYIFKGWILSNNISLSQVSHPVYNVKLLECL